MKTEIYKIRRQIINKRELNEFLQITVTAENEKRIKSRKQDVFQIFDFLFVPQSAGMLPYNKIK